MKESVHPVTGCTEISCMSTDIALKMRGEPLRERRVVFVLNVVVRVEPVGNSLTAL